MNEALSTTTTPKNDLRSILAGDTFKSQVALALPKHMDADRFSRIALTALTRSPKLLDCTRESVLKCCIDLSSFGLEPDGRNAHLVPYGNEATLIIDYKGLIALAKRSGDVKDWRAEMVKEKDQFSWENGVVDHKVNWREDRGKAECVYSCVVLADGSCTYEVMTLAEVEAIRKRSKAGNSGPWVTDFNEMAKKTVIRRHSKRLTLSPEFHDALAVDGDKLEDKDVAPKSRRPVGDPFREGAIEMPQASPTWQELYPHKWGDEIEGSTGKTFGQLADADDGENTMRALWRDNPANPALCAWGAGWIQSTMPMLPDCEWEALQAAAPALPETMLECSPKQLREAAGTLAKWLAAKIKADAYADNAGHEGGGV